LVAGSLATIAVLVFAAVQIPKWRAAKAGGEQAPVETQQAVTPPPQQTGQQPQQPPQQATDTVATPPQATQTETATAPPRRDTSRPPSASGSQPVVQPPPQATQQTAPPTQPPPQQVAPEQQRGPDPAVKAELRQLRERMMLQATRLSSSKEAIENMRRTQARSGLGMRQDVVNALNRAEFFMDESEDAMKAGDPAEMRKALDSAERQIEILERFLGR
jgi:hypothetical protein